MDVVDIPEPLEVGHFFCRGLVPALAAAKAVRIENIGRYGMEHSILNVIILPAFAEPYFNQNLLQRSWAGTLTANVPGFKPL